MHYTGKIVLRQIQNFIYLPSAIEQWGTGYLNRVASQVVNLPLSVNSILFVAAQDGGDGAFTLGAMGEDRTLRIYQSATQNPGGVLALIGYHYIAMCQG